MLMTLILFGRLKQGAESIQRRKVFKGGNYLLLGRFYCGNYSKEETIQGRKLFAEIRYLIKAVFFFYF